MNTSRIAITGALTEEIQELLNYLQNHKEEHWNEITFHTGELFGREVVIVKCGVGKVFAALTTQKLIELYNPESLIFTGVAGALNPAFEIGDIVLANDCTQHDLDATGLGIPRGTVPYTNYRLFNCDKELLKKALQTPSEHTIHTGRILTGDQFLTDSSGLDYLTSELKGDAVEMEGAAVGFVCTLNKIPFLIIRTISDKADHSASVNFTEFVEEVSKNSLDVLRHLLS